MRGTNPAQVNAIVNGTSNPCATADATADTPCGVGQGDIARAILDAVQALSQSDRATAMPRVLLITKGPMSGAAESSVAAAIADAMNQGVLVDSVVYASLLPPSELTFLSTTGLVALRYASQDLAYTADFFPMYLLARLCTTPAKSECGACCGECDATCATCLPTTLACPVSDNCSYSYRNTQDGCCYRDENDNCPYIPGMPR
jgi:hypothetical protein